jgi:1-acyl-sn-glycerol-3-phosphate acyltransferase
LGGQREQGAVSGAVTVPRTPQASPRRASLLRTAAAFAILPPLVALFGTLGIALVWLGVRARAIHALYVAFGRAAMWSGGTPVEVRGREHLEPDAAYVVVSNHESAWDPLCMLAELPELVLRFVVKRAAMRVPLFGHALRASGNITVARTDTAGDVQRIQETMERRDPGVSILFFAEGTRSRDGALHPFKKGAFATAIQERLPVLPVAVAGGYRIWPKGTLLLRPGPVAIEIGAPIPVAGLGPADRAALRERSFRAVHELRAAARERLRKAGVEPGGID